MYSDPLGLAKGLAGGLAPLGDFSYLSPLASLSWWTSYHPSETAGIGFRIALDFGSYEIPGLAKGAQFAATNVGGQLTRVSVATLRQIGNIAPKIGKTGLPVANAAATGRLLAGGIKSGVYAFVTKEGQWYAGMSSNIAKRLAQHIRKDKLAIEELNNVFVGKVSPTLRRVVEQAEIDAWGGIKDVQNIVANVINSIAKK
jgi:hypothetical protein